MFRLCAFVLVAVLSISNWSVAQSHKFSGTITSVPNALSSQFSVGESITGDVFIGTTPIEQVGNEFARYGYGKLRANIGSKLDAVLVRKGELQIDNNLGGTLDQMKTVMNLEDIIAYPVIPGHPFQNFSIDLQFGVDAFSNVNLQPQFAPATLRDNSRISFDDGSVFVEFSLTDFSAVPEPGALSLAAIGGALCLLRSGRQRQARQHL
jgi:hypothetical protein